MTGPNDKIVGAYGTWNSPITAELIASSTLGLGEIRVNGPDVYWNEFRPLEGGRYVVIRQTPSGQRLVVNPDPLNARTRVHEYGGGSYVVAYGGAIFSNFNDQRLYSSQDVGEAAPLTSIGSYRYADASFDPHMGRVICVREDHNSQEPVNSIVSVNTVHGGPGEVLVRGNDFYAAPRISADGRRLAYLTWNHPFMPWDRAELWVAELLSDGGVAKPVKVAGGDDEATIAPQWSSDGVLYFVSDRSGGWWNIHRWREGKVESITEIEGEFGYPMWRLGQSCFDFVNPEFILCAYTRDGVWRLAELDIPTGDLSEIQTPYTSISDVHVSGQNGYFIGGSSKQTTSVVKINVRSKKMEVLRKATELQWDDEYLSTPEPVNFSTSGGALAHGMFYRPASADFTGPGNELPPLLVKVHGGPTSSAAGGLRLDIQYYTSRGFAVLDVNYRGSSGYGREYRQSLYGHWGEMDVDDVCAGAMHLADTGRVDRKRMAITGQSAGGYTVLATLTFRNVFSAGSSHFGVSDCEMLAQQTHKFESRYLESLIAPYPRGRDVFHARSPIYHVDKLDRPVIFFQGLEDRIVPPNQAKTMFEALRSKGIPTAYVAFEGEQHGFRRSQNIVRVMEAELYFFGKMFGFTPPDKIEPVPIENLP